jgi:hypothetical protein
LPPWAGDALTGFNLIARRSERRGFLAENVPYQKINIDESLRKASKNILLMHFIGFFDRLHETATYLNREFGIKVALDKRVHQTRWMPSLDDLPSHLPAMLARKTEADYEFVNRAKQAPAAAQSGSGSFWRKLRRS